MAWRDRPHWFCAIVLRGDRSVPGTISSDQARDSRGPCFCALRPLVARRGAQPSRRDHRPRQGTGRSRRLRGLPYRRPRQAVRRRQADRHSVRRDLFAESDAGSRYRPRRAGATTIFAARCATGWPPTARAITRPSPIPISPNSRARTLLAIRAYLATLAPVHSITPPPELRWPLNYRILMRAWNCAVLPARHRSSRTRRKARNGIAAPIWSRARRIAAPATRPRTCSAPTGAARPMAAGRCRAGLRRGSTAPTRSGLKSWSADDIVEYLQSGRNGRSHADGPMAEVVVNSTSKMSDGDVRAIAVYLKGLPAGAPEPVVAPPPPDANGRRREAVPRRLHRLP